MGWPSDPLVPDSSVVYPLLKISNSTNAYWVHLIQVGECLNNDLFVCLIWGSGSSATFERPIGVIDSEKKRAGLLLLLFIS